MKEKKQEIELEEIKPYSDRFGDDYYEYLKNLIETLTNIKYLEKHSIEYTKEELEKISNSGRIENPGKYKKYVRIYFNGMSCRTLLGRNESKKDKDSIDYKFVSFLKNEEFLKDLNDAGIRLKIRFLFPYIYSDFVYSMTEGQLTAQAIENDGRPINYNFSLEKKQKITKSILENSRIAKEQQETLNILISVLTKNTRLKITGHDYTLNSLQIRYTAAPIYLCSLIINDVALCDPYLFAKQENDPNTPLAHRFPVIRFLKQKQDLGSESHFEYIKKHMGTLWSCDTSVFCSDALNNYDALTNKVKTGEVPKFKMPYEIDWERKIFRIKEKMKDDDIAEASPESIATWLNYMKENLRLHTNKYESAPENKIRLKNGTSFERPKNLDSKFNFKESFFQLTQSEEYFEFFLFFEEDDLAIFKKCRRSKDNKPTRDVMVLFHNAMIATTAKYEFSGKPKVTVGNGSKQFNSDFLDLFKDSIKCGNKEILISILEDNYFPVNSSNILIDTSIPTNKGFMEKLHKLLYNQS